eukprot:760682-Hanusia_phi.AAC.1
MQCPCQYQDQRTAICGENFQPRKSGQFVNAYIEKYLSGNKTHLFVSSEKDLVSGNKSSCN